MRDSISIILIGLITAPAMGFDLGNRPSEYKPADHVGLNPEPPLEDGYVDYWKAGWYDDQKDTDWFAIFVGSDGHVTWTLDAEQSVWGFV
nr:hypothetical protein [Candidatus Krumholzibacteria bacterium]